MKNKEEKVKRSRSTLLQPIKKNLVTDPQKNMLSLNKLNSMLHKLKKYYNDMNNIRKSKDAQVELLEKKKLDLQKQIQCKENFADIDFPTEKISIQDYQKLKETKEEIQIKIEKLINEKNQLLSKYKSEIEYGNTLNNLISIEKKNYENLHEHLFETTEKMNTIKTAKKNLEMNRIEYDKKQKIFHTFKKIQEIECDRLDKVITFQEMNNSEISQSLLKKLDENRNLHKDLIHKEHQMESEHKNNKDKVIKEIEKNEKIKIEKLNEQNKLIKLILGLDLIKNYFIDLDKKNIEIDNCNLLKSDDYKLFNAKEFIIIDEDNNVLNNVTNLNFNTTSDNFYNNKPDKTFSNNNNLTHDEENSANNVIQNNSNMNNLQTGLNKTHTNFGTKNMRETIQNKFKIYLKDIKEKLENLDMDFDVMYNFYTKIINKTNFFHNHMINFNFKQISLESKKDQYIKQVKEIIEKNSKNIEDLIKFNPKFQNLLNTLNIDIKTDSFTKIVSNKLGKLDFISKVSLNKFEEFYKKCQKYFSDLKTFNEFISFNLEKLVDETQDEILKEKLKGKFQIIKKNLEGETEKNSYFDKFDYLSKLLQEVELEYIREKSKLEKIDIAISEQKRINEIENGGNLNENENYKGLPFIDPYSNWPIEKLNLEKMNTLAKIKMLQNCINLKKYFENNSNKQNIFGCELPLEKITFDFLSEVDMIAQNLRLTKQIIDIHNLQNNFDKSIIENVNSFADEKNHTERKITHKNTNLQKKKENGDRDDMIYCYDEDDDEKEFKKEFPKSSTNFFIFNNKKKVKPIKSRQSPKDVKDALIEFPQIGSNKESQIIEKFYMPFIKKKSYNIKINNNLLRVKSDTRQSAFDSHHMLKKKGEVKNIGKELLIYQNPNINIDNISNITYNSMVKYVIGKNLIGTKDYEKI